MAENRKARKKKKSIAVPVLSVLIILGLAIAIGVSACNFSYKDNSLYSGLYPRKYNEYVEKASKQFGVPEPLIYGIIRTESGFNPDAGSDAGAKGLMQLMPDTFEWLQNIYPLQQNQVLTEDDLYDPQTNIMYGTFFLSWLLDRYTVENTAVAAYNAGFGAVDTWLEDGAVSSDGKTLENIPYVETANYVDRVESAKKEYIELYY